jgi:hypothetical protein
MVYFNELRFSKNNKSLIIDVAIDNQDYYENVFLDSIVIDTQNTFIENGPSSNPVYTHTVVETFANVYTNTDCQNAKVLAENSECGIIDSISKKQIRLEIPVSACGIDPSKDIVFVYVIVSGNPAPDTPCGMDSSKIMATVVNLKLIYDNLLSCVRQVENDCDIPKSFIDIILRYKAFELFIKTGNYTKAIQYWKKYLTSGNFTTTQKQCRCYV